MWIIGMYIDSIVYNRRGGAVIYSVHLCAEVPAVTDLSR